ncbi:hypothetical protein HMPREF9946_02135 [Acetobacteraceae bacterium AT-5844]|nr:hypothetical protein HMPREF9946_02135 [Acetobacteraceae bacterium AT-5844]
MINLDRFSKIWAMTKSTNVHEAAAAMQKAKVILAADGKTLDDVPALLSQTTQRAGAPTLADIFSKGAEEHAVRRAQRLNALVEKYGSVDAVGEPTVNEALLDRAVKHLKKRVRKKYFNGTFWTDSLAGWTGWTMARVSPPEVVKAVSEAYPLPATVDAAKLEKDFWDQRALDLHALHGPDGGDEVLSLAAQERRRIVEDLFWTGLRSRDIREVLLRVEAAMDDSYLPDGALEAIKTDLEALA